MLLHLEDEKADNQKDDDVRKFLKQMVVALDENGQCSSKCLNKGSSRAFASCSGNLSWKFSLYFFKVPFISAKYADLFQNFHYTWHPFLIFINSLIFFDPKLNENRFLKTIFCYYIYITVNVVILSSGFIGNSTIWATLCKISLQCSISFVIFLSAVISVLVES